MASLKQATYLREAYPEDSKATIFYIDLRASGKYEDFLMKVKADENITLTKGKVAKIEEDSASGDVTVTVEDILGGGKIEATFDMVVLAAGMEPAAKSQNIPANLAFEANGFMTTQDRKRPVWLRCRTEARRCRVIRAGRHRRRPQEHSEQRRPAEEPLKPSRCQEVTRHGRP